MQRISQNARLASQDPLATTYTYRYDSSAGTGVDIYVIGEMRPSCPLAVGVLTLDPSSFASDTGIYTAHVRIRP